MTGIEESAVDAYILKATEWAYINLFYELKRDKTSYTEALKIILRHGNLPFAYLGEDETILFSKILSRIGISFNFGDTGLKLSENAKFYYQQNVMYRKNEAAENYVKKQVFNRVGKDEPDSDKLGWADRKRLNNI